MDLNMLALIVLAAVVVFVVLRSKKKTPPAVTPVEEPAEVVDGAPTEPPKPIEVKPTKGTRVPCVVVKDGKEMKGEMMHMPQGLQVWDEEGNLILDLTTRLMKVLGTVDIDKLEGSVYDAKLEGLDHWCVFCRETDQGLRATPVELDSFAPTVTRSGTALRWKIDRPVFYSPDLQYRNTELLLRRVKAIKLKMIYGVY